MISFLNQALLVSGPKEIETVKINKVQREDSGAVFLIDSKVIGETQPLVEQFRKNYEETSFGKEVDRKLNPLVNGAIHAYISNDVNTLFEQVNKLSAFQLNNLGWMIPDSVSEIWQNGLTTNR